MILPGNPAAVQHPHQNRRCLDLLSNALEIGTEKMKLIKRICAFGALRELRHLTPAYPLPCPPLRL